MSNRLDRANSVLQKNISSIIENDLNDPRLNGEIITISKVVISSDLKYAKVFVSILSMDNRDKVLEALNNASNFIARELKDRVKFRVLPVLTFILDTGEDYSQKINSLLKNISYSDEANYNDDNYTER